MEDLITSLKTYIIEQLNLRQFTPEQIDVDEPLIGGGLGLDSIDALELIVMIEKNYGLKISNPEEGRKILSSIRNIAEFIQSKKA
jgi:acyl carrier protein